ncbi:hypothetical protein Tco_0952566 [Tanacetum coccineum]|uniref:Retrovirus-related Pol polyprotein from transposon TNT 1-94-like beta-barrel domain-containing protein n=1 Tax=Tanacetum coccineum TaxID=301880 RepID=A0ABQ5DXB0_9ASTR
MTTPIVTSTTDSQIHNNIMAAGSKDRLPMLAIGRYAQWQSRFLRYIDTRPNGDALRKCILKGRQKQSSFSIIKGSDSFDIELELEMKIYSTVDACQNTQEMWGASKRLTTSYMAKIQEVPNADSGTNSEPLEQDDQNDVECDDERVALANLIANLKLDVDENKKIQKQLKKANATLTQELTECKSILAETSRTLGESNIDYDKLERKLNETLGLLAQKEIDIKEGLKVKAYEISVVKEKHDELVKQSLLTKSHYEGLVKEKTKANEIRKKIWRKSFVKTKPNIFKNIDFLPVSKSISKSRQAYNVMTNNINHLKEIVDQAWVKHSNDRLHLRNPTAQDMEILVKTCLMPLALKTQNDSFAFVHELKQEMHADLKYVESLEDEIDELESDKAEFSNMYDMLLQECVSNDIMCSYLQSSSDLDEITELQCLYLHKVRECDCLAQKLSEQTEFVSKEIYTELLRSFAKLEKHSISLEIALQQCQEQLKNDTVCKEKASNVFRKEREQYFEIQDLKAQLQDKNIAISELKKLIEKCKGKSMDTKFDKPSVVRQPNAQRIPKPSVLGKPAPFSDSLERTNFAKKNSVSKTNESEGMYRIVSSITQTRAPQLTQTSRNTNPCVSTSTRVAHGTNVSRPQPRSNQMKDKVLPNTSQVKFKKTEVEDHPRISHISNQTKSVTMCNDSLNSRTSNVIAVCATYGKLPISTRKPKSQANKSVATPHKKTVASESTTTNSKSYYRMLYKKTSKAWKWWIAQQCPSAYTWVPKTKKKWIVQLILFIVDSGCTKHMTGNLSLLCNFVEKYLGTVRFGNDQFALILGYGDLVQGNNHDPKGFYASVLNDIKASDYDNPGSTAPEQQNVFLQQITVFLSQQVLDLIFGPLYDEFFYDGFS